MTLWCWLLLAVGGGSLGPSPTAGMNVVAILPSAEACACTGALLTCHAALLTAVCRMVEAESGVITIDGVDISTLGLRHLRSQMSIIPQEPFLFSGTVRSNLDPFNSYTEIDLWRSVEAVGLKDAINALQDGLDAHVVDGGNNFSQVGPWVTVAAHD